MQNQFVSYNSFTCSHFISHATCVLAGTVDRQTHICGNTVHDDGVSLMLCIVSGACVLLLN